MKQLVLVLLVLISLPNWAQDGRPSRGEKPKDERVKLGEKPPVEEQVKRLTLELNLNELQQLQVREILLDQEKKFVDFNPEGNDGKKPSREEMETRMEIEKNFLDQKMKKVLKPAQFTIWLEKTKSKPKQLEEFKK